MELLVIIIVSFCLCLINSVNEEAELDIIDRPTKLNPNFYVDEDAFMEVAHALGFGTPISSASVADHDLRSEPVYDVPSDTESNVYVTGNGNCGETGNTRSAGVRWG